MLWAHPSISALCTLAKKTLPQPKEVAPMDFALSSEQLMVQETVRRFVDRELIPLEAEALRNEGRYAHAIPDETYHALQMKAKNLGFWGINTPKEYGGADLGAVMTALIAMDMGRTLIPFAFGGGADNILYEANED